MNGGGSISEQKEFWEMDAFRLECEAFARRRAQELGMSLPTAASSMMIAGVMMGQKFAVQDRIPAEVSVGMQVAPMMELLAACRTAAEAELKRPETKN